MAFTTTHVLLRCIGVFGSSVTAPIEMWANQFRLPAAEGITGAQLAAFLGGVEVPAKAFYGHSNVSASSLVWFTELTAAMINTDGKYLGGANQQTTRRVLASPTNGTGGSASQPLAFSTVVTTRTPIPRGRGSHGRFYVPTLARPVQATTGMWSATQGADMAGAAKAFLDGINNAAAVHLGAAVHLAVMSDLGAGTTAAITRVEVGSKPDHQERREHQIKETYAAAALATTSALLADNDTLPVGKPRITRL